MKKHARNKTRGVSSRIAADNTMSAMSDSAAAVAYLASSGGGSFELDNQAMYHKLKAFLIDSPGWAWIEPHDSAENG
jgi:hypothetical protein